MGTFRNRQRRGWRSRCRRGLAMASSLFVIGSVAGVIVMPSPVAAVVPPEVSGGGNYTCALLQSSNIVCWGVNPWGELGDGTTTSSNVPVAVTGVPAMVSVAAGDGHTCGIDVGGHAWCWGSDYHGELGNGKNNNKLSPVAVSGGLQFSDIATGGFTTSGVDPTADFTCGVTEASPVGAAGQVDCWGYNGFGQLGNGTTIDSNIPVPVSGLSNAVHVAVGAGHACRGVDGRQRLVLGPRHQWSTRIQQGEEQVRAGASGRPRWRHCRDGQC